MGLLRERGRGITFHEAANLIDAVTGAGQSPATNKYAETFATGTSDSGMYYVDVAHALASRDCNFRLYFPDNGTAIDPQKVIYTDENNIRVWIMGDPASRNVRVVVWI